MVGHLLRPFTVLSFFFSLLIITCSSAHAQVSADFSGDQFSDPTYVSIHNDSSLGWAYRESDSGTVKSLTDLGKNGNHLVLAHWKGVAKPIQGAVSTTTNSNDVTWKILNENGQTETVTFGKKTDLLVSGADFDGSGSSDACAIEIRNGKLFWKLSLDPFNGGNTTSETEFGVDGDVPFFARYDGSNHDWFGVLRRGTDGSGTIFLHDPTGDNQLSFVLAIKLKSAVRPFPVRDPVSGKSYIGIPFARSAKSTRVYFFNMSGQLMRRPILPAGGTLIVGDFIASSSGEEIAIQRSGRFSIYNPFFNTRTNLQLSADIPVDEINIQSFGAWGGTGPTACTSKTASDGYKVGFVWKPNSDTQHYAVAVLPARYTSSAKKVSAITTGGTSINSLRNKGCGNPDSQGPRCGWLATPYTGSSYKNQYGAIVLKVEMNNGTCDTFLLSDPSKRID